MVAVGKMKDKCKDAARVRREKERIEFAELAKLLPLPASTTSQLDKASVIRLTSSYLRMRAAFPEGLGTSWGNQLTNVQAIAATQSQQVRELGSLILQTLDGFVFALHRDGKIMYVSETASVHLGLPQIDLTGSSVFEYVHQADHADLRKLLQLDESEQAHLTAMSVTEEAAAHQTKPHGGQSHVAGRATETSNSMELGRAFCLRMKCILPKRNAGLVSNGFKTIHCNGYLKVRRRVMPTGCQNSHTTVSSPNVTNNPPAGCIEPCEPSKSPTVVEPEQIDFYSQSSQHRNHSALHQQTSPVSGGNDEQSKWESCALVAVGHSLLPSASTEVKLTGSGCFMFRASLDLRIHYVEPVAAQMLGYQLAELQSMSLYQLVHAADLSALDEAHRQLLDKGQMVSRYFRLVRRFGGCVWLQCYASLVNNSRVLPKQQHVVGFCSTLAVDSLDSSQASPLAADCPPEPSIVSSTTTDYNTAYDLQPDATPDAKRVRRTKMIVNASNCQQESQYYFYNHHHQYTCNSMTGNESVESMPHYSDQYHQVIEPAQFTGYNHYVNVQPMQQTHYAPFMTTM